MSLGPWFSARFDSECGGCGDLVEEGGRIRASGNGDYLCVDCGEEVTNGEWGGLEL